MAASTRKSSRLAVKVPEREPTPIAASTLSISSAASASTAATPAVTSSDKRTSKKAKTAASGQVTKDHKDSKDSKDSKTQQQDVATPSKGKTQGAIKTLTKTKPASQKRPASVISTDTTTPKAASADHDADEPKAKPPKRRRKSKADDNSSDSMTTTATTANEAGPSRSKEAKVNPSDPCSVLPTEIWHKVLSQLPLSQVAKTSWVSKTWLDGARAWRVWQQICEKCTLGTPKLKYKTFMAIVCANSYFICDKCYSHSTGSGSYVRRSAIPLKVKVVVKEGRPRQETKAENENSAGSAEKRALSGTQVQGAVTDKTRGVQTGQQQQGPASPGHGQMQAPTAVQGPRMDQVAVQSSGHEQLLRDQTEKTARTQENRAADADKDKGKDKDAADQPGVEKDKTVTEHPKASQDKDHRDSDKDPSQDQNNDDKGQVVKQDKGKGKAKEELDEEATEDWHLCLRCRQEYHLSELDLCGIPYEEYDNPHYRYGAPMCLYEIDDVEEEALRVHGGWVGIRAVGAETAKERRAAFKARQAAANPRRRPQKAAEKRKQAWRVLMIAERLLAKETGGRQVVPTMPKAAGPTATLAGAASGLCVKSEQ
ncbi:hypothetical protein BGZ72_000271 [Mortierella alpina]|nr:hypothetical protein BGZ72_000271 [Mortierella alpina]